MGIFDGYLIASDFDGTFAGDNGEIPQRNINKIKYYISEGGKFTVSTGRTYQGFHKYDPAYINAPVLLCNGVTAYDYEKKEMIFNLGMGENALRAADRIHEVYPDVSIEVYPFGKTYVYSPCEKTDAHLINQNIEFKITENGSSIETPVMKMMLYAGVDGHDILADIAENVIAEFDGVSYIRGFKKWLEIVGEGADKGTGLHALGSALGIDNDKLIAVGDGYNDADMLSAVENSFTPDNGCETAKKLAKYIVCSNNDGCIADVIEILEKKICT